MIEHCYPERSGVEKQPALSLSKGQSVAADKLKAEG
jgi:hypothetical protein